MKTCNKCNLTKELDHFNKSASKRDGKQAYCSDCAKAYHKAHYRANSAEYIRKNGVNSMKAKARAYAWIRDYCLLHPCVDCGNDNFVVIHFDHVDPSTKCFEISYGIAKQFAWPRILEEIEKCVPRCANCHAIRTSIQQGWHKCLELLD